jgi:hypothetical protein
MSAFAPAREKLDAEEIEQLDPYAFMAVIDKCIR